MSSSGHTSGRVMLRKRNHSDARSMDAASYRYLGTAVRPASAMSMMNGVHCQVSTTIRESNAVRCRVSHSTCPNPSEPSMLLMTPNCASSMKRQNSPTTTGDSIIGTRKRVVSNPRPWVRREIR